MAELTASPRRSASEAHGAAPALTDQFRAAVRSAQQIHSGQAIPESPMSFAKFPNSLVGDGEPVVLPAGTRTSSTTRRSSRS